MADTVVKNANKEDNDITILGPGEELSVEEELQMGEELENQMQEDIEEDDIFNRIFQEEDPLNIVDLRQYQYKDLAPPLY